jgi:predicted nucleic acid-binding protein
VIVLDTNVISELARRRADPAVVSWANAQPMETLYSTAITEAELLYGLNIMVAGARRDTLRRAVLTLFGGLLMGRILSFDSAAAAEYADWAADRRRAGKPVGVPDLQIAAIARARRARAIATRNTADFAGCGVAVIDPWAAMP